ncbi:hypothetical protein M422DRAFT_271817 [Sphaerobolus stellatus SS14]|uniref:Unplaced genomic scaffold SPHSTscaffold_273, whole genome shotgun sequence n=1 Tax=Sphaerobolus stellatus (strain SS14) TaxID=990650 RepID=A0A0C9UD49_SPHS4|nr:hypothetical protein M422DRAFT_271817 [Sphaerobolus stellatus SS14]
MSCQKGEEDNTEAVWGKSDKVEDARQVSKPPNADADAAVPPPDAEPYAPKPGSKAELEDILDT